MRLIDADALKEYIKKVEDNESAYTICAYIDNAPTVEERPKGEWIEIKDRLPEAYENYLVAYHVAYDEYWTEVGYFDGKEWWVGDFNTSNVIAWQVLPKPYKRGDA